MASRNSWVWRPLDLGSGVMNIIIIMALGKYFLEAAWSSSRRTGVESEQARCEPNSDSDLLCSLRGLTQPL